MEWIRESNLIEGVDDPTEDKRCLVAWNRLERKAWDLSTVLWLHRRIMCVLHKDIAGKWRNCDVRVGNHLCPPWYQVVSIISEWTIASRYADRDGEEAIRQWHIRFEKIHPFEDGNGRTGRMLMNWQRVKAGLEPMLIKASERQEYYKWFTT